MRECANSGLFRAGLMINGTRVLRMGWLYSRVFFSFLADF